MIPWQLADCRTREISNDNDGYCVLWDRDADVAYYRGAMGILLVYDVCDERSFNSTSLSLYLSQLSNPPFDPSHVLQTSPPSTPYNIHFQTILPFNQFCCVRALI